MRAWGLKDHCSVLGFPGYPEGRNTLGILGWPKRPKDSGPSEGPVWLLYNSFYTITLKSSSKGYCWVTTGCSLYGTLEEFLYGVTVWELKCVFKGYSGLP